MLVAPSLREAPDRETSIIYSRKLSLRFARADRIKPTPNSLPSAVMFYLQH